MAKRAISTSCREHNREHVDGIRNDMEAAELCGNSREVFTLTRILSGRLHTRSINPSKALNRDLLVTQDQRLDEWSKFLGAKFASPDGEFGDEDLHKCIDALPCGKGPGCESVPVEAYRGSVEATKELFRICRLMQHNELYHRRSCVAHLECFTIKGHWTTTGTTEQSASCVTRPTGRCLPSWLGACWKDTYPMYRPG